LAISEDNRSAFGFSIRVDYNGSFSENTFIGLISNLSVTSNGETKYSVDFAERYADIEKCSATVMGGQLSNDKTTFRILSGIKLSEAQLSSYTSHGFEISLKDSTKGAKTLQSSVVYTSVQAAGATVNATDGYLGAMTVTGLSADKDYTFIVRAFVVDAAGNKYMSKAVEISTAQS
jgi:hypothetical protein